MNLTAIYLHDEYEVAEISHAFNLVFHRSIERTYEADLGEKYLYFTEFDVLAFVNFSPEEIGGYFEKLDLSRQYTTFINEHYQIEIDKHIKGDFAIENEKIILKKSTPIHIGVIAHVVCQSVALETFEIELERLSKKTKRFLRRENHTVFNRKALMALSREISLFRHDIVADLHLLDKPNILWDNENAEAIYNALAEKLELKERFEIVEYKVGNLKEDIGSVSDLINLKHSEFLEWIIIGLIAFEILMGLYDSFIK